MSLFVRRSERAEAWVFLAPVPEMRRLVEVARAVVAGELHFSHLVGPTAECMLWTKIHGSHPAIRKLVAEWELLADQVWNDYGQHGPGLPVETLRRRLATDLGIAADEPPLNP